MENQELTFGQKAVGLNFNHAEGELNLKVHRAKQLSADLIDMICPNGEQDITIAEFNGGLTWFLRVAAFNAIKIAQMEAVKYLTWKD
jgi:hypothetical protein